MDSRQEARLNMYDAVLAHCNANTVIVATVPAFQSAVADFQDFVEELREAAQNEVQAITGFTADKNAQRQDLINITVDVAGSIFAFASAQNNLVLKDQVKVIPSDLTRMKDELLGPFCTNILDAANANAAALVDYGVTAGKISALDDAIDDFVSAVPAPRNAVSNRVSVSEQIKQLFKDGDQLLKERMDKLALQFKTTQPNFYTAYRSNRVILDAATSATQVSGIVRDAFTNNPLSGVAVQVVDQSYSTVTNGSGEYTVKIPVPGEYNITFTKADYQVNTQENVEVTLGQNTDLDIILTPIPT